MGVAFLGFREALVYAWQKQYITEQERSEVDPENWTGGLVG